MYDDAVKSLDIEAPLIADGPARWWRSAEGVAASRRIEADVRSRYRDDFKRSGWLRQVVLEVRMRKEIAAERATVLPPQVLWTRGG